MKEENIKILRRALQTNRACVRYSNIQHFSWKNTTYDKIELKVYTSGGVIIQEIKRVINLVAKEYMNEYYGKTA